MTPNNVQAQICTPNGWVLTPRTGSVVAQQAMAMP